MRSNTDLVKYCESALTNSCYIFGTWGNKVTESLIDQKAKQYPSQMTASRVTKAKKEMIGKTAWDCSGLIKGFLMDGVYNSAQDRNAAGMYSNCTEKGSISSIPEIPGILVFNKSRSHVGVYIGGGQVIQAKGFNYGVIKSDLAGFSDWGKYKEINYSGTAEPAKTVTPAKPAEPSAFKPYTVKINTPSGVNVRTGAGVNFPKAAPYGFWNGERVEITAQTGNWGKTFKGWICLDYCKKV